MPWDVSSNSSLPPPLCPSPLLLFGSSSTLSAGFHLKQWIVWLDSLNMTLTLMGLDLAQQPEVWNFIHCFIPCPFDCRANTHALLGQGNLTHREGTLHPTLCFSSGSFFFKMLSYVVKKLLENPCNGIVSMLGFNWWNILPQDVQSILAALVFDCLFENVLVGLFLGGEGYCACVVLVMS